MWINNSFPVRILVLTLLCCNIRQVLTKSERDYKPEFLRSQTEVTLEEGQTAILQCRIRHLGPKTVFWRKNGTLSPISIGTNPFSRGGKVSVNYSDLNDEETKWDLVIRNVTIEHSGEYQCQISATIPFTQTVKLTVTKAPVHEIALKITGTFYVDKGNTIHLYCNASGARRAPEDVDWFFSGNRIHTQAYYWYPRTQILKYIPIPGRHYISELIIERSRMTDKGVYICRSSDGVANGTTVHILNTSKGAPPPKRDIGSEEDGYLLDMTRNNGVSWQNSFDFAVVMLIILTCHTMFLA